MGLFFYLALRTKQEQKNFGSAPPREESDRPEKGNDMNQWRLKHREPVVRIYHSGQVEEYSIRIMWSDKLGLRYKEVFDDYDIANESLNKIEWSKYIDIREWDKDFYPSKYYLQTYAD